MSMRTLVEINLDHFGHALHDLPPAILCEMLARAMYQRTPDWQQARADLEAVGFKVIGERHHTQAYTDMPRPMRDSTECNDFNLFTSPPEAFGAAKGQTKL
ncbi:MAG: hypothetical protein JNM76_14815 [Betaproteobacteria bacterium]|nr:hypothetical protein [Betaproteobacteria bacterium]